MTCAAFYLELNKILPGRVKAGESMKKYTSWRIGGPAELFVEPVGREELQRVVACAYKRGIRLTVIGAGSNLLVSDRGIKGVVVKVGRGLGRVWIEESRVVAEAGAKLAHVAATAKDAGFGGFEFSAGIPGAVGGALAMNAGANGASIGDLVHGILLLSQAGEYCRKSKEEMDFGYRTSVLRREPWIVIETTFCCRRRDKDLIKKEMDEYRHKRRSTQPITFPSAGSVFKNPPGYSAGRLIESSGLKGMRIGGAEISDLHANFIVNLGWATARDVLTLIDKVREAVHSKFGVELELEVNVVGDI